MFFTYAEKQNNSFFGGWTMRAIAIDVERRHLYYSEGPLLDNLILPPNVFDRTHLVGSPVSSGTTSSESTQFPRTTETLTNPSRPPLEFLTPPPSDNIFNGVTWKAKLKIDVMIPIGREHEFVLEDPHIKERDLYQVELHGDTRAEKVPPSAPLLCPSSGFAGIPQRMTLANEEFIRDPNFMKELYEALRVVFSSLRLKREAEALAAGISDTSVSKPHTLDSPKSKGARSSRAKVVLRFRTDFEFRRFLFVVQTVLGYDKIIPRPYRGLPPYDPRNGIMFSLIPMYIWHTFKALDRAVIYSFLRGELVGNNETKRNSNDNNTSSLSTTSASKLTKCSSFTCDVGERFCTLKGLFLCISHDTVFVMNDCGHILRWVHLNHVSKFCYNISGDSLYFAFITDEGYPDIVFIPQPPSFGEESLKNYCPVLEVLRVQRVVHETCFASVVERRVIELVERREWRFDLFINAEEQATGRPLQLTPSTLPDGMVSCPLPKEQLGNLWREVQSLYTSRGLSAASNAAVPLYDNNTNEVPLTKEQMEMLTQRLNRERGQRDQIVGVSYAQAQRMELNEDRNGPSSPEAAEEASDDEEIYFEKLATDLGQSAGIGGTSFPFQPAQYITTADLASSHAPPPSEIVVEHHAVLTMAATPQVNPCPHVEAGFTIDGLIATSFSAYNPKDHHLFFSTRDTAAVHKPKPQATQKNNISHSSRAGHIRASSSKTGEGRNSRRKKSREATEIHTASFSQDVTSANGDEFEGGLET